ncbi:hypothetical protein Pcinc_025713 [Petrolisthes cinctipes]|uniref:Coiled-coil domain-containing protein 40 n=1 Tax=Petrolisthes cinctipes TaxID=88211 RepID=A0AAE1F7D5_PETCI|nr:hypothetical protein Pcinc_025713 [Petrolisthes cinctipes]
MDRQEEDILEEKEEEENILEEEEEEREEEKEGESEEGSISGEDNDGAGGDDDGGGGGEDNGEEDGIGGRAQLPSPLPSPPPSPTTAAATSQQQTPAISGEGEGDAAGGGGGPSWASVLKTLGPDHPLLRRFQDAKKRHLEEEKSQLQLRLRQLRQQAHDLQTENVGLGSQLFDVQQAVTRAQVNLDKVKSERCRNREAVTAAEEGLRQARQEERSLLATLNAAQKHEREVKLEVERVGNRVSVVRTAKERSDGDVTTLSRILHNTAWDRANLEKDKMMQERQFTSQLNDRARNQREELHHLECEGVGVRRAWEAGVVRLARRSTEHTQALQHLDQLRGQQAERRAELLNTRKEVKENQLKHESESIRLLRLERDVSKQRERLAVAREESQQVAERHEQLLALVEQLEARSALKHKEERAVTRELERVYERVEATTVKWRKVEDQVLDRMAEQTAVTKAASNLRRAVTHTRTKCRALEDELVEKERGAAAWALKSWEARAAVQTHTASHEAINALVSRLHNDVTRLEGELKRSQNQVNTNQSNTDKLNKQLAKVLQLTGDSEAPPGEREERRLRLLLRDKEEEKRVVEEEALTVQRTLLEAKAARDALTHLTTRLQQEVGVLRGREARVEGGVERERGALKEVERQRERLQGAVTTLDTRLHQEKQHRDATSREADTAHTKIMARLQELERAAVTKESERERLEERRVEVEGSLLEATRERAQWERHLEELKEARDAIRKDTGDQGELHAMKTEITRMQARWRSLEATQKELSGRLEQSVGVEGALKTRTQAMVTRLRQDPNAAKATRVMHQDILRRKLTKGRKRLRELEEAASGAQDDRTRVEGEARRQEQLYAHNVRLLQEAATHLEEKLVNKQEEQLRLQECRARLRHLTAVREGRYKTLAAAGEEAQQAMRGRLGARSQAYTGVLAQLEAGYPHMEFKLRNIKILLHNFLEKDT